MVIDVCTTHCAIAEAATPILLLAIGLHGSSALPRLSRACDRSVPRSSHSHTVFEAQGFWLDWLIKVNGIVRTSRTVRNDALRRFSHAHVVSKVRRLAQY
ncbi:unnamed protein product [Peniophora sp. CBMAI 1063]|nr:unnamed protein product [Peniophora sp. CBMAI 1063]